jgi:hypothetical protein
MLTLFTTAKPFHGHNAIIQRNALKSWTLLHPDVEIILFGDDEGAAEVARELGIRHEPHLDRNEFGTSRLDYMFASAQAIARNDFVCYSNCDIVLMSDFWKAFEHIRHRPKPLLMIGKRWDTDVAERLAFANRAWEEQLRLRARAQGVRRRFEVDYFVFPKGLFGEIAPLAVGRLHWDHWLVWKARSVGASVIDASFAVTAVHQNHDYRHHPQGREGVWNGEEARRNFELGGNGKHLYTFDNSTHLLTRSGLLLRTPMRKRAHETQLKMLHTYRKLRQSLAEKTFPLRNRVGLRRQTLDKILGRQKRV